MYNNQDILKKHTATKLAHKDVDTSLMLLPLRIETRIRDHQVEDVHEPDKALYAFKALAVVIESINSETNKLQQASDDYLESLERLDVVYKEDKARLRDLSRTLQDLSIIQEGTIKLKDTWKRILSTISRLSTVDFIADSEATILLNKLEKNIRRIYSMCNRPPYDGISRMKENASVSTTAKFKAARKHLSECLTFFWTLIKQDDGQPTAFERIKRLTGPQWQKLLSLLKALNFDESLLTDNYKVDYDVTANGIHYVASKNAKASAEDYYKLIPELLYIKRTLLNEREDILSKMHDKIGPRLRYTLLAEHLLHILLNNQLGRKQSRSQNALKHHLHEIANNTFFHFHEEREWLIGLDDKCGTILSHKHINQNNASIRHRKLSYKINKKCLLLRIYPDEAAVTQILDKISVAEIKDAKKFWTLYRSAGKDSQKRYAAWEALCDLYEPCHAAWIAQKVYASNGFTSIPDEQILPEDTFTIPVSQILPDRFMVEATLKSHKGGSTSIIQYGRLLPSELQVGINLNEQTQAEEDNQGLMFKGPLRWMTDYDEAERMGMAITIPLTSFEQERTTKAEKKVRPYGTKKRTFSFSSIYVTGIKEFSRDNNLDSERNAELLGEMLLSHLYSTEGLQMTPIGTPTNILTDDDEADYDTSKTAQTKRYYDLLLKGLGLQGGISPMGSDERSISELLLQPANLKNNAILQSCANAGYDIKKAKVVNKAFINAMAQKGHALAKVIRDNNILSEYFSEHVLSRGQFAPLRIGNQPYGILPVTDFSNLLYKKGTPLYVMKSLLLLLTKQWNRIAQNSVITEKEMTGGKTGENYLKAISAKPYSTTFISRYAASHPYLINADYFRGMRRNERPLEELYNTLLSHFNNFEKKELENTYLTSYQKVPLTDVLATRKLQDFKFSQIYALIESEVKNNAPYLSFKDGELRQLIIETYDLFSYRLDAWMTGLLSLRLSRRIKKGKHKIAIGAYGWVFDLDEDVNEPQSQEYVLAPSLNHAITAAILRSCYNRSMRSNQQDRNYDLSVNLSSRRVRQALRIIKGLQNGLSLGAILGNDLERLLHESYKNGPEMDYLIFHLRKAFPLQADSRDSETKSIQQPDVNVTNGLAIMDDLWQRIPGDDKKRHQLSDYYTSDNSYTYAFLSKLFLDEAPLTDEAKDKLSELVPQEKRQRLLEILFQVDDSFDALSDVVTSESVYKLTQGNRSAMEALMQSLQNESGIPIPEVTEIPLTSAHIEQRVLLALDASASIETDITSCLANLEPSLNQWMTEALGFDQIGLTIQYGQTQYRTSLAELGLSANELVFLSSDWSRFEKFLSLLHWTMDGPITNKDPLVLSDLSDSLSLKECAMATDSIRNLLDGSRELRISDLVFEAQESENEGLILDDVEFRIKDLQEDAGILAVKLGEFIQNARRSLERQPLIALTEDIIKEGISLAIQCFRLGMLHALDGVDLSLVPLEGMMYTQPTFYNELITRQGTFLNQLDALLIGLQERMDKAVKILSEKNGSSLEQFQEAAKALTLSNIKVIPSFKADEAVDNDGQKIVDTESLRRQKEDIFSNTSGMVMEDWMSEVAMVRDQMQNLHQARMWGKWHFLDDVCQLTPMQLPLDKEPAEWTGAVLSSEDYLNDRNTYVLLGKEHFMEAGVQGIKPQKGLLLDYWVERIPYQKQTAGLAFAYDQPSARPPQAILVGVSTKEGHHFWSQQRLLKTLRAAMHMAKTRAVEPDHLLADRWASAIFPLIDYEVSDAEKEKGNENQL